MQTLRMLGTIALSSPDGTEIDAILRQPKSVALLAYLALPRPGTWHRRDVLLATFWPELSQSAARAALRSALHLLRRHLAAGTVRTRGDDEVGVDPALLVTDAGALLDDVDRGDLAHALDRYAGGLLPGLYIADTPEFEQWLESERARLSIVAYRTATALADTHERIGELSLAIAAAARGAELAPFDESATRRWIALLDRAGDRAQALAVYERLRQRVAAEFGAEPAPETVALVEGIRRRATVAHGIDTQDAEASPRATRTDAVGETRAASVRRSDAAYVVSTDGELAVPSPSPPPRHAHRRRLVTLAVAASVVIVALSIASIRRRTEPALPARLASPRIVLLPIERNAADTATESLAPGIEYGIARRLERTGALGVRLGASLTTATTIDPEVRYGGTVLLRVRLDTMSDSVAVRASLIDSASRREGEVMTRRLPRTELRDVESQVATAVAGALHRVGVPFAVRHDDRPADPEAYRLTILGYHQLIALGNDSAALASFLRATALDPSYARAWSGLASVWGLRTTVNAAAFDEGYERTAAAASRALALDSTQGSALASLGAVTALKYRRYEAGASILRRAMAYEPSNPEVFVIASFANRYLHRWDDARDLVRVARQLDPLNIRYLEIEARVDLCAERPEAAERLYREGLDAEPENPEVRDGLIRSLALQGRFDAALDLWRTRSTRQARPEVATALKNARGRAGYYAARHLEGRLRLDGYRRQMAGRVVPRLRVAQLRLSAGDSAAGFASLDSALMERADWLFRLPCFNAVDEYRGTSRYKALLTRIGEMPAR